MLYLPYKNAVVISLYQYILTISHQAQNMKKDTIVEYDEMKLVLLKN